jgi:ferredoxin
MRVTVDMARCGRHGLCVYAAPDVFFLDEEGELRYDARPPDRLREQVLDAAFGCPAGAIEVQEAPSAAASSSDRGTP